VTVTVVVTMASTNYASANGRAVLIRLLRPGIVLPPNRPPVPGLFFSPAAPGEGDTVTFDGSLSTDDGQIVSYAWSFGDGGAGSGVRTAHRYQLAGSYNVVLTVTDDRGARASAAPVTIAVTTTPDPEASFTVSPADPVVGQLVSANANGSKAAPGRSVTSALWDFGDGSPSRTGMATSHTFTAAGSYVVVLTVTDSAGRKNTTSQTVVVRPR
jgi:PKD repeat protein